MEHTILNLEAISIFAAELIGFVGVAIMLYGCLRAVYMFVMHVLFGHFHLFYIRINLGKYLALGLEFLVGMDIIESLIAPSWEDLGKLAAIIGLRSIITFFLSWELKEIKEEINTTKEISGFEEDDKHAPESMVWKLFGKNSEPKQ